MKKKIISNIEMQPFAKSPQVQQRHYLVFAFYRLHNSTWSVT